MTVHGHGERSSWDAGAEQGGDIEALVQPTKQRSSPPRRDHVEDGHASLDQEGDGGSAERLSVHSGSSLVVDGLVEKERDDVAMEDDMAIRMQLIERRLDDYEDEKDVITDDDRYALSESTFSFLITAHPLSVPFAFAPAVSKGTKGNPLGIPAGVTQVVRTAQFFGVLMEDEIPQGLQLIANAAGHALLLNGRKEARRRVIVSSIFRLVVGYLFLSSLFINIAQNADVLEIFYDVLALEFVENLLLTNSNLVLARSAASMTLPKRGFFGKTMLMAANARYTLTLSGIPEQRQSIEARSTLENERRLSISGLLASNNRTNYIVRFVYFLNVAVVLAGLAYIAAKQDGGHYRCNTISVLFDEVIWEDALVLRDDRVEERLLLYPYFNGLYMAPHLIKCNLSIPEEDGTHDGYPRYVEANKYDGRSQFGASVTGAELVYCSEIASWIFRYEDILPQNECFWLWRSPQTQDYDIVTAAEGPWEAWIGEVKPLAEVAITCNECSERSDCNYHGNCVDSVCQCFDTHFGDSCEFELPCPVLSTEKAQKFDSEGNILWQQENLIEDTGHRIYNRPIYIQEGLSGEPYDLRLHKILEKEVTATPSCQPSGLPSIEPSWSPSSNPSDLPSASPSESKVPTYKPTQIPSTSPTASPSLPPILPGTTRAPYTPAPTAISTYSDTHTVGTNKTSAPTPLVTRPPEPTSPAPITPFPTEPLRTQNEYETNPDFADWDDFFEAKPLHDLEEIMEDYAVVLSYSGSRFYGTIVNSTSSLGDLFPKDYHAFWSDSFDVNRTFIISDSTFGSTLEGVIIMHRPHLTLL
ncbi:hypothetical protein ACHAXT_003332 [Thalassiosira profunda]